MQDSGGADTCGWVMLMTSAVSIVFSWSAWDKTVTTSPLLHWTSHLRVGYEEKSAAYTKLTPVGMIFPAFFLVLRLALGIRSAPAKSSRRALSGSLEDYSLESSEFWHHEQDLQIRNRPNSGSSSKQVISP